MHSATYLKLRQFYKGLAVLCAIWSVQSAALAYVPGDPWSDTASGAVTSEGTPITLTWSFAPDGTDIPGEGDSDLIEYFDDLFNVSSGGSDLKLRPWFTHFQQSFDRWGELGGITFVYEQNDNGAVLQSSSGILNVRGDIRLGGAFVDGPSSTLAFAWLPNSGDIVFDTGETTFFSDSTNNYRQLRNTLMHELGHAIGMLHVESSTDNLLMEPAINTSFDGPQLDDIRGLHGLYGDALEKTNSGLGNGSYDLATSLGSLSSEGSFSVGSDADTVSQAIAEDANDFVSIANSDDADFFSFTVAGAGFLDASLTPRGGVFNQGVEGGSQSSFNANARNDLSLAVFDTNGTSLLELADNNPAGQVESLSSLELDSAGEYFIRVQGAADSVQLYQLELSFTPPLEGDFNFDGVVDRADLGVWNATFGDPVAAGTGADANGNGLVDSFDFLIWQANVGAESVGGSLVGAATVPEPNSLLLCGLSTTILMFYRRRVAAAWRPCRMHSCAETHLGAS